MVVAGGQCLINIQVDELSDKPDSTVCQREVSSAGVMAAEIFEMSSVRVRRVVRRTDDLSLCFGRLPSFAVAVKRTVAVKRIVLDLFSAEDAHVVRFRDQKQLRVGSRQRFRSWRCQFQSPSRWKSYEHGDGRPLIPRS